MRNEQSDNSPVLALTQARTPVYRIGDMITLLKHMDINFPFPAQFAFRDFMIVHLKKGSLMGSKDGMPTSYYAPCMISIQPDNVYQHWEISPHTEAVVIAFSKSFTERLNILQRFRLPEILSNAPDLRLDEQMEKELQNYTEALTRLGKQPDNPYLEEALLHLTLAFFYSFGFHYYQIKQSSRGQLIADEYLDMVEKYGTKEHFISFYSNKLCLSPKYLQNVVKKETGRSPYAWIEDVIIKYAKQLLTNESLSIQEIAAQLNFANQTYFAAFFRRVTGMTPRSYRKSQKK